MAKKIKKAVSTKKPSALITQKKEEGSKTSNNFINDGLDILNEDAVAYGKNENTAVYKSFMADKLPLSSPKNVVFLSGYRNKPSSQLTGFQKMNIVREGVSKKALENLKEKAGLDYDDLAVALSVTRATLINKKGGDKFNIALSERIVSLADIYSYGYEVFEDVELFNEWMFRPNQALAGQAPYHFVDNQFGREELRNIIGRIEYGVYS